MENQKGWQEPSVMDLFGMRNSPPLTQIDTSHAEWHIICKFLMAPTPAQALNQRHLSIPGGCLVWGGYMHPTVLPKETSQGWGRSLLCQWHSNEIKKGHGQVFRPGKRTLCCSAVKWLSLPGFTLSVSIGLNSIFGHQRTPRQGLSPKSQHARTSGISKKPPSPGSWSSRYHLRENMVIFTRRTHLSH